MDNKVLGQPAHPCSLIRAFVVCLNDTWVQQNVSIDSQGPDETVQIHRIVLICNLHIFHVLKPSIQTHQHITNHLKDTFLLSRAQG